MGSGDWLKTIMHRKKTKQPTSCANQQSNGFKSKSQSSNDSNKVLNGALTGSAVNGMPVEDIAAIRIQTAYRSFKARKTLRSLKRFQRLQTFTTRNSVQKQALNTSIHVQSWSKIQAQIRARRASMVVEGRIRQKKIDNQLKLEAKLQDLELEWNSSAETKEEIITRIQQREEAAVKRERAMAYAFSHQWRASSGMNQGPFVYELAKGNWEWSWVDKWIAAQPWETRPSAHPLTKPASKVINQRVPTSSKPVNTDGKVKKPSKQSDEETTSKELNPKVANSARSRTKSTKTKQELQSLQVSEIVA
ncbi:protein IQ-DOMAIN 1 isoform X1 [Canna indica]|uniref:Protein IQ-DOMAIN 1 isoform X1 n=1 Tax=Canna indica TaxID=4628 RepID=A0AAQ3K6J6_9LILI|nr:protein IQ-DOMAIN 1 isoform X1 [Canna indica]